MKSQIGFLANLTLSKLRQRSEKRQMAAEISTKLGGLLSQQSDDNALQTLSERFGVTFKWDSARDPKTSLVVHQVKTAGDELVGSGILREQAIKGVFEKYLSTIPVHAQTIGEFKSNTIVVPVKDPAPGSKDKRLLVFADSPSFKPEMHSDQKELEFELEKLFDASNLAGRIEKKDWVTASLDNLLSPFHSHLKLFTFPGGKNLILSRTPETDAAYVYHKKEVAAAVDRGDSVPEEVLLDYPEFQTESPKIS